MLAEDGFDELLWLARVDALASNGDLQFVMFCERRAAEIGAEAVKPPRLLTGHDLIAMGFEPGPRIGEVLRALETAQLEGEVVTRDDALAWARRVPNAASQAGPSSG
jgi:poly(A) polymerase